MRWKQPVSCLLATTLVAAGCGNLTDDTTTVVIGGPRRPVARPTRRRRLCWPKPTTAFNTFEDANDGLGPIFNAQACGQCHTNGAIGGAGEQIERRFGRFDNGVFNPLANRGRFVAPAVHARPVHRPQQRRRCNVPLERRAAREATVRNVGRLTTPTFGLGLVDAMPDSFFDGLVAAEPAAQRGTVNRGQIAVPNPGDPIAVRRRDARHPLRVEGGRAQPDPVLG